MHSEHVVWEGGKSDGGVVGDGDLKRLNVNMGGLRAFAAGAKQNEPALQSGRSSKDIQACSIWASRLYGTVPD